MDSENVDKNEKNLINLGTILKPVNINEKKKKKKKNGIKLELENDDKEKMGENIDEIKTETIEKSNDDENLEENISKKDNTENVEFHKLYESDDNISRKSSLNISNKNDSHKKKKVKAKLNTLMLQSYFHKSYDKVSNVLKKTSKSFLKKNSISNEKKINNVDNLKDTCNDELTTPTVNMDKQTYDEYNFFEKNSVIINKYLDDNINLEKQNEKLLKKYKKLLENNDSTKFLEELKELLDEKILLIKTLIYYKNICINYKKDLNKYKNSFEIFNSEKEQLSQNIITLKKHIDFLNNNIHSDLKKENEITDLM
ncbi:conserved Plasmodium protein, unknown function [Plasmodium gallinaceum]|uniref:Uncharacterized protein n=1 Tax=Plasmodium gallinaceum TaxID=5849 RepID=A0A1J1GU13_PLAGA|nr:conserved Plasmodium protein, unknown function [Plasmodium gallinaceum]CRG95731.1 conserved Plasmodium protein, unknown function [Plasmodium gallinaceum]